MRSFLCFFGILCLSALSYAEHEDQRVPVTVYYESLCPDSRKFFIQQLYPSLQGNLSGYVNLTLIPYGKSSFEQHGAEYKFTCHHGVKECLGNKIHACALKNIDEGRKTNGLGYNRNAVGYINCLMDRSSKDTDFPTKECAELNQVTNLMMIENCAMHLNGAQYLANYGSLTDAFQKPLASVPTIVFNKHYKKEDSDMAQTNFVKALCQYIPDHDKIHECLTSGSNAARISIASLALLAIALFHVF